MSWVADHLVLLAALTAAGLLIGGILMLLVAGLRAWRVSRRAMTSIGGEAASLTRAAEAAQARVADLSARGEELAGAREDLDRQIAVVRVIGEHLGRAIAILRAPLRAIGR